MKPLSYLLDTNICVSILRGNVSTITRFQEVGIESCCISEITVAELLYGAECSANQKSNKSLVEEFCQDFRIIPIFETLETFAKEKARLRKEGQLIDDFDLLIGSAAKHYDMTLVTDNIKHLERIKIKIENWLSH